MVPLMKLEKQLRVLKTEAAIAPRLFILLTPKLAWEILIIISSDAAFYIFDILSGLQNN